jgi:hypothetical protein
MLNNPVEGSYLLPSFFLLHIANSIVVFSYFHQRKLEKFSKKISSSDLASLLERELEGEESLILWTD